MKRRRANARKVRNVGSRNQFRVMYIFSEMILLKFLLSPLPPIPRDPDFLDVPSGRSTVLHTRNVFIKEQGKGHLSHLPEPAGPWISNAGKFKNTLNIFLFYELETVNVRNADASQHFTGVQTAGLEAACTLSLPRLCFGSVGLSLRVMMISFLWLDA